MRLTPVDTILDLEGRRDHVEIRQSRHIGDDIFCDAYCQMIANIAQIAERQHDN